MSRLTLLYKRHHAFSVNIHSTRSRTIKLKTVVCVAVCSIAGLFLSGCINEIRLAHQQAIDPVQVTFRVVDQQGRPIPGTVAKVIQQLDVGTKMFCLSLPGGKGCTKYKDIPIFKGKLGDDGEQSVTVEYASPLIIRVATACRDNSPTSNRQYFHRVVSQEDFSRGQVLILGYGQDPDKETSVTSMPCHFQETPLQNWGDFF
ncbi:hypothetical protein IFR09_06060 [Pseudomonas syringae]|nr:hypothetical protein [Pseudomonas syringae]MBD8574732.1 hypothetical protein [Pseudomonas syringae]MBD8789295.1 hypothetical protein [Pseudomonas syringae]MBD8800261.1 hypothetical protein [Pseudomonas syringae]MBD8810723.1 hypothetical protein [Pseudomonas syringae]